MWATGTQALCAVCSCICRLLDLATVYRRCVLAGLHVRFSSVKMCDSRVALRCVCSQTRKQWSQRCELRQLRVTLFACTAAEAHSDEPARLPTISNPQTSQGRPPSEADKQQRRPKDKGVKRKGNKGLKKGANGRRK